MCDTDYCTIDLPEGLIAIEAIDFAIKTLLRDNESNLTARIVVRGIEIFVKADSIPERLALGYEHEKQKQRAAGVLPSIGPIGPYVSDVCLNVYICGIVYYNADRNNSDDYPVAANEYENSINRLAIYG
jgi:hypothetical protein